ncbi:MAG: hypothetical protein ACYC5M_15885 [Anaerolineae bacterium]
MRKEKRMKVLWRTGLLVAVLGLLVALAAGPVAAGGGNGAEVLTFHWGGGSGHWNPPYYILGWNDDIEIREISRNGNMVISKYHYVAQYTVTSYATMEVVARARVESEYHHAWNQKTGEVRVAKQKGTERVMLFSEENPLGWEPLELRFSTCIANGEPRMEHIWLDGKLVR